MFAAYTKQRRRIEPTDRTSMMEMESSNCNNAFCSVRPLLPWALHASSRRRPKMEWSRSRVSLVQTLPFRVRNVLLRCWWELCSDPKHTLNHTRTIRCGNGENFCPKSQCGSVLLAGCLPLIHIYANPDFNFGVPFRHDERDSSSPTTTGRCHVQRCACLYEKQHKHSAPFFSSDGWIWRLWDGKGKRQRRCAVQVWPGEGARHRVRPIARLSRFRYTPCRCFRSDFGSAELLLNEWGLER